MCHDCGRELCGDCHHWLERHNDDLPTDPTDKVKILRLDPNRRQYLCAFGFRHFTRDLIPVSRFDVVQLDDIITRMTSIVAETITDVKPLDYLPNDAANLANFPGNFPTVSVGKELPPPQYNLVYPADPSGVPSFVMKTFAHEDFTEDIFRPLWAKGDPIVVTGLLHRFDIEWTPEYFIEKYGDVECQIVDCQSEKAHDTEVGQFFKKFGKYENRKTCWKLKVRAVFRSL